MSDLLLDERIMYWVFFPIIYVTFLISLFRFYYSLYSAYTTTKKPVKRSGYQDFKDTQLKTKCQMLIKKNALLTESAFNCRRTFLCKSETGYLQKTGKRNPADLNKNMMQMQSTMMDGLKGNFVMILTTMPAMAWIGYFFAGFLLAKVPFALTQKCKTMTQSGIDMESLDVRYVSGVSFYFLIMFGLGQINHLFLRDDSDANIKMSPMMANPAQNPMMMNQPSAQQQVQQIFKNQIEGLELVHHHFSLSNCPKHALNKLNYVLSK